MKNRQSLTVQLFILGLANLAGLGAPAYAAVPAQDTDNGAIAAAKNAALVIEGQGNAPVKPNGFYVRVEISAENKDRAAAAAECRKYREDLTKALDGQGVHISGPTYYGLLRRTGQSTYQGVMNGVPYDDIVKAQPPGSAVAPGETLKALTEFAFGAENPAKVRQAFAAMRATGAQGLVTVGYSADAKAARLPALKAALLDAQQRVKVLGEAAKPKVLEIVFIREGEFQIQSMTSGAQLQGSGNLDVYDTIDASASVTFFYGLKPGPQAAPGKTAKPTKSLSKTAQTAPGKP